MIGNSGNKMDQRVCRKCNLPIADEDWFGYCECCGELIGPCCLSELEDPPYCDECERKTREH